MAMQSSSLHRRLSHVQVVAPRPNSIRVLGGRRSSLLLPKAVQLTDADIRQLQDEVDSLRRENAALKLQLSRLAPADGTSQHVQSGAGARTSMPAAEPTVTVVPANGTPDELYKAIAAGIAWPQPGESTFYDRPARSAPMPMQIPSNNPPAPRDSNPLQIVHITAEMAPLAKVGGLGDVVTGLARSCLQRGHDVRIILPFYECLKQSKIQDLQHIRDFDVPKGRVWDGVMQYGTLRTSVYSGIIAGCPVWLVRPTDWNACPLFRGGRIYGGSYNEGEAYLYFCRAALELLKVMNAQPHILHIHEWQACAAAMLYWDVYHQQGISRPRVVLTMHNMDSTGEIKQEEFAATGLPGDLFAHVDKALDERTIGHNPERLSLLKGGIVYSNVVTTVSPTYAKEVLEGGAAGWLRHTMAKPEVKNKVVGVLNGIDLEEWDPASDASLPANFSAQQPIGKALCKRFLQRGLGLKEDPDAPLVAVISRLVPQKGVHLIQAAVHRTAERGGQFVLLGSGHMEGGFKALAEGQYRGSDAVRLLTMYNNDLAHLIYAAADIVVVPSMFEPCGLTQMIAMRYGAVPVVRRTGGLADTVFDVSAGGGGGNGGAGNGYVFDGADEQSLFGALDRALADYKSNPELWHRLSTGNMQRRLGWAAPAGQYVDLYRSVAVMH